MATVQSNGITLEYDEHGSGEPLLLVMGLGGQLIDWPQGLVDRLVDEGFRVIRFDNRDAGLSTEIDAPPPSVGDLLKALVLRRLGSTPYTLSDMAADAVGLLDALDIDSAHVVGISMGGMIAQTIAIEHPERVRSLTSIMSTTGNRRVGRPTVQVSRDLVRRRRLVPTRDAAVDTAIEAFQKICGPTFDPDEFRVTAEAAIARSYRPAGTARQMAAILTSPDRTKALGEVRVPTLVVHGLVDPLVRRSGGMATADAVPGATLIMFDDMGHDLPRGRWRELASAIAANAAKGSTPVAQGV